MSIGRWVLVLAVLLLIPRLAWAQAASVSFTYDRALPPRVQAALIMEVSIASPKLAGWTATIYSYDAKLGGKQAEGSFTLNAKGDGSIDLQTNGQTGPCPINRMIGIEFTDGMGGVVVIAPMAPPIGAVAGATHTVAANAAAPPPPAPSLSARNRPESLEPPRESSRTLVQDLTLTQLNGLPFGGSSGQAFSHLNQEFAQIVLANASSTTAYDFTELKVYHGCDPAFFNSGQFNGASAIASASSVSDILAVSSTIPGIVMIARNATPMDARLAVPCGAINLSRYELLVGKARPYLGNNQFGSEVSFAVATRLDLTPMPAASSPVLLLMGLGMIGLGCWWMRSRPRRVSSMA